MTKKTVTTDHQEVSRKKNLRSIIFNGLKYERVPEPEPGPNEYYNDPLSNMIRKVINQWFFIAADYHNLPNRSSAIQYYFNRNSKILGNITSLMNHYILARGKALFIALKENPTQDNFQIWMGIFDEIYLNYVRENYSNFYKGIKNKFELIQFVEPGLHMFSDAIRNETRGKKTVTYNMYHLLLCLPFYNEMCNELLQHHFSVFEWASNPGFQHLLLNKGIIRDFKKNIQNVLNSLTTFTTLHQHLMSLNYESIFIELDGYTPLSYQKLNIMFNYLENSTEYLHQKNLLSEKDYNYIKKFFRSTQEILFDPRQSSGFPLKPTMPHHLEDFLRERLFPCLKGHNKSILPSVLEETNNWIRFYSKDQHPYIPSSKCMVDILTELSKGLILAENGSSSCSMSCKQ